MSEILAKGKGAKVIWNYGASQTIEFLVDYWALIKQGYLCAAIPLRPFLEMTNYSLNQIDWIKENFQRVEKETCLVVIDNYGADKNKKNWVKFHKVSMPIFHKVNKILFPLLEK